MSDQRMPGPELTLNPFETPALETKAQDVSAAMVEESRLSEAEQKMVNDFAQKIDVTDSNVILQYGAAAQQKIASFSDDALANVRTREFGEVGEMLSGLVVELKGFGEEEEPRGLAALFRKPGKKITELKARYDKAEVNVNKIVSVLEDHQLRLMKDIATLDKMYDVNLAYFKELSMYILAGKKKLEEARANELQTLIRKAQQSGLPEDAQKANDFATLCNRFEKRIHDLELTRIISIQMAPQIRLVQNNDAMMTEKIQSTIVNTIPLWKSQMVIALGLAHSQQAVQAQRQVTNMTNELLRKNAEALKQGTLDTAREAERGIVDIETLTHTNELLISTLDEVIQVQEEGRQKRQAAELELHRIEGQLKEKLLDIRNATRK